MPPQGIQPLRLLKAPTPLELPNNVSSLTLKFQAGEEKSIASYLKSSFKSVSETSDSKQKIISKLELESEGRKVFVIFYSTGKCLVQGSEGPLFDLVRKSLIDKGLIELNTEKTTKYLAELDENNFYKEKNFIVGFDEAGTGETIGSAIFAAVILPKELLDSFSNLRKDIKSLSGPELNYYCELMKKKGVRYEYVVASAYEVCNSGITKNRFMDKKYVELIRKLAPQLNKNYILMLDDYGVKEDILTYLKNLDKQGVKSICRDKLDENITACKLASIIARHIRYSEVKSLEANNLLNLNGKEISFGKGGNSEQTETWLRTFRELNPSLDFPDFVKKSWSNVVKIEKDMPRKIIPLVFNCKNCNNQLKRLLAYHISEEDSLKFYCSICYSKIEKDYLKSQKFPYLLADTNSLVIGTVSHDLRCTQSIFEGSRLLIPHKIMAEIDTIGKGKKIGAHKELERLKELEAKGKIKIDHCDFEVTSPFDADKKLYDLIAKNNSCALITADRNLAISAQANNAFVFHIINYIPMQKTN
jgi:ribonuclease HII/rRNA-processing protein FCF1